LAVSRVKIPPQHIPKAITFLAGIEKEKEKETNNAAEKEEKKETKAQVLLALAREAEYFQTPGMDVYATFSVNGHRETWPVRSRPFRRWLTGRFCATQGKPPGGQTVADVIEALEAEAQFGGGPEVSVYTRVAEKNGRIYLDLADEIWSAVEVGPDGWEVVANPPVRFRRTRGMLPLPRPVKGGNIEDLRLFLNLPDDDAWRLVVAWLLAAFRPIGPYPILLLQGEQGSAKSTTARVLRALVDPSTAPLRTAPRDERDLMIGASNAWVLSFDNLSGLSSWLSDALCRLATGGGFATRELYSDSDEVIFDAMRPVILNGIDDLGGRPDLLDRAIVITLPAIPEEKRRDEATFWAEFEAARPRILGALLDAVCAGLRNWATTRLNCLPRMADFARWAAACESACPWERGEFMTAYAGNRAEAVETTLEADAVAVAIKTLLTERTEWEGTAAELLAALQPPAWAERTKAWPGSARAMANKVRRLGTFLRQSGVEVEFYREAHTGRRLIHLQDNKGMTSSPSSPSSPITDTTESDRVTQRVTQPPSRELSSPLSSPLKFASALDSDDGDDGDDEIHTSFLNDGREEMVL